VPLLTPNQARFVWVLLLIALVGPLLLSADSLLQGPEPRGKSGPRRYELEFCYVLHRNLTDERWRRLERLFLKAHPSLEASVLQPTDRDRERHHRLYRERLRALVRARGNGDLAPEEERAVVWRQVDRELRARAMLDALLVDARWCGSVKEAFDKLAWYDDRSDPACAVEPGRGLLVYRHVDATAAELVELKDGGVRFGVDFRARVIQFARGELPLFSPRSFVFGGAGEGRFFYRLLNVELVG